MVRFLKTLWQAFMLVLFVVLVFLLLVGIWYLDHVRFDIH